MYIAGKSFIKKLPMNPVKFFPGLFPGLALGLMLCGCQIDPSSIKAGLYNNFSSNMLEIPKNTDDFDFLEGRWEEVAQLTESTHHKGTRKTFEFDKYGFGTVWNYETVTKQNCVGQALATFIKDGLEIRTLNVVCPGGRRYVDTVSICREEKVLGTICHADQIGSSETFNFTLKRVK